MGTTSTFLKSRVSKPTVGKWSSGFGAVKKYAEDNNVPIIGVWSNGDKCGYCTNFENTVMNSAFMKWMASSGCVFWFGCSNDKTTDDKHQGTGFTWVRNGRLTGGRIRAARLAKGLSQEELAEKIGVSRQAVSKWERSCSRISSLVTDALAVVAWILQATPKRRFPSSGVNSRTSRQASRRRSD